MKTTPTKFSPSSLPVITERLPKEDERLVVFRSIKNRKETIIALRLLADVLERGTDADSHDHSNDSGAAHVRIVKTNTGDINQDISGRKPEGFPTQKYALMTD